MLTNSAARNGDASTTYTETVKDVSVRVTGRYSVSRSTGWASGFRMIKRISSCAAGLAEW